MRITCAKLNNGWIPEPNVPEPMIRVEGEVLVLRFWATRTEGDHKWERFVCDLHFAEWTRYRLGPTNEEGYYRKQCRFSLVAPGWGDFYEMCGPMDRLVADVEWDYSAEESFPRRHFLLYFLDETFECRASGWTLSEVPSSEVEPFATGGEQTVGMTAESSHGKKPSLWMQARWLLASLFR